MNRRVMKKIEGAVLNAIVPTSSSRSTLCPLSTHKGRLTWHNLARSCSYKLDSTNASKIAGRVIKNAWMFSVGRKQETQRITRKLTDRWWCLYSSYIISYVEIGVIISYEYWLHRQFTVVISRNIFSLKHSPLFSQMSIILVEWMLVLVTAKVTWSK